MGTSSIFNGRNDKNPLLPDDYENETNNSSSYSEKVLWQTVKTDMSKYINSGGRYTSPRHIAKQYIKASGGTKRLVSQSKSGISAGVKLGTFFNSIRANGIEITFKNFGIEYSGRSVHDIFSKMINVLAPESNTKENIVAREATQEALVKLYDYVERNNLDIQCLNEMPLELLHEALAEYVGSYIWILMMKDLGSRLEMYIENSHEAYKIESEFKDMIMSIVNVEFEKEKDILNKDISRALKELYSSCLSVMEGII
ncbi:hypothetical protein [Longibaculum muris]|uniref:hypothetical protein n=1 Tax=Longibaculum muris TaxID=1796628 RepID=UPI00189F6518|nr:hypothetical protein [Longibaculum muris]